MQRPRMPGSFLAGLLALVLLLGLSGEGPRAHYVNLEPDLAEPGTLTVGLGLSGRPFAYRQNGEHLGFEVELAKAVADAHGLDLKLVQLPRAELITALMAGEVDIINTLPIEEGGEELWVLPYLTVGNHALVLKGNPFRVKSEKDLAGRTVAVTGETSAEVFVRALNEDLRAAGLSSMHIHSFPNHRHTHIPVSMGHAAAYFVHTLSAIAVNRDPESRVRLLEGVFRAEREVGFAIKPAHENLHHAVEHAIAAALAIGKYDAILAKWDLPADLSPYKE